MDMCLLSSNQTETIPFNALEMNQPNVICCYTSLSTSDLYKLQGYFEVVQRGLQNHLTIDPSNRAGVVEALKS